MRKRILITGASSGLGRGMAREFARAGSDLALCARRIDRLQALKAELEAAHPGIRVAIRSLDVTQYDEVFRVFGSLREELGGIDRVVVNAGIGQGAPIGKGQFALNRSIVETNFLAALAQCEAAMEIFREASQGHLVLISSMSAMRGMRGGLTAYAASKAGVASMAEGIRTDMLRKPAIKVSTIFPGYIRTEMNDQSPAKQTPYIIDEATGCRLLVRAIEKEKAKAYVPWWPWAPLGWLMKRMPLAWVAKLN
ncbi:MULTISPECIES: SDR family oxidoreductase [unclassified Lysobacter]|uniref:SDR family oxidoreductase n=1 Tax=unclassified Lysobacter TaxID=2635362 RepID=UPI001BEA6D5D|nr:MULTISPECIES: SDR family oxidoreductase [unclassified Lysobacter]MBT2747486.1 SDR family oxidoreductase [Lysobacter sp. ISL-42]MBT2752732.1 SDR family oxidoreductase [Lysobacter sp. ISL-50]MBT2778389.1 SDR family oxidoreductase [Lysobacter sp. ISL-54]MBT2783907.1 SDR family oxidoreductase [Lysobacter sp. ISL-52]